MATTTKTKHNDVSSDSSSSSNNNNNNDTITTTPQLAIDEDLKEELEEAAEEAEKEVVSIISPYFDNKVNIDKSSSNNNNTNSSNNNNNSSHTSIALSMQPHKYDATMLNKNKDTFVHDDEQEFEYEQEHEPEPQSTDDDADDDGVMAIRNSAHSLDYANWNINNNNNNNNNNNDNIIVDYMNEPQHMARVENFNTTTTTTTTETDIEIETMKSVNNNENMNYYNPDAIAAQHSQLPAAATSPASVCYSDDSIPEMKYTPNEFNMQPPASSGLDYNYTQLQLQQHQQHLQQYHMVSARAQQSHQRYAHAHAHAQPHPAQLQQHQAYGGISAHRYHNLPPGSTSSSTAAHAMQSRVPPTPFAQSPAGYYPNMWYPNAPYGTSSKYHNQYAAQPSYGHHQGYSGYSHDPMLEMLQLSNSGREARNRAEKNRRDKLNGSIQELSTMVPHVAESPKRVDKTAVLRFAAHGLRLNYIFGNTIQQERPQLTDALMKLLDSFFLTLTCHGQIVLISNSIEQHLGHCQADLYGQNILQITHPEDHAMIKQQLIPTDLENLFDVHPDDDNGETRPRTQAEEDYIDKCLREDKRSFTVRLARAGPRSETTSYEIVKLDGCFRRSDAAPRGVKSSTFISSLQLIRRTRGRDDTIPLHTISGNDIVLVAVARIIGPPKFISRPMENTFLEYKTRHLIDGRIIDCDQRISLVAGYMRDEVQNLSPFTFIHQDDVRWVIVALRQMYDCNSSYGESTYRLYTRNRNFIYLQTKGYLEIDKNTNQVHSFVCINTLLDEEEGKRRVQEMKNKFSVFIKTKIPQSSIDAPAAENPQQLEKAVLCLIQNLQKSPSDDEETSSCSFACTSSNNANNANTKGYTPLHMTRPSSRLSSHRGSSKTPPLALVPPEPSTIKSSISKSLSVVNVTPATKFRKSSESMEPMQSLDEEVCEEGCGHGNDESCACYRSDLASSLKRSSCSKADDDDNDDDDDMIIAKRRLKSSEIENVLTSSLDQIERTLSQQWTAANELRDCGNKFQFPNTNERIDEILEEHQEQSEMYRNIKSEYEVQRQNMASTTKNESDPQKNTKELRPS